MSDTEDGGFDGASFFSLQSPGSTSPTRKQCKETTVTVSGVGVGDGKQVTDGNSTQLFQLTVTVRNSAVGGRVELYHHVRGKNNKAGKIDFRLSVSEAE